MKDISIAGEIDEVYYHGNCSDGAASAWVYRNWLMENHKKFENVKFIPVFYGKPPPDVRGKRIAIFDFSWKLDQMEIIMDECESFILIDHHKTAFEELFTTASENIMKKAFVKASENLTKKASDDLKKKIEVQFNFENINEDKNQLLLLKATEKEIIEHYKDRIIIDLNYCGCVLVWKWLYGNLSKPPLFLGYIQDRDLWKWELENSREFSMGTFYDPDCEWSLIFNYYDKLYTGGLNVIEKIIEKGRSYQIPINKEVERIAHSSKYFEWKSENIRIQMINSRFNYSDLGNAMLEKNPRSDIACIWFYDQWAKVFKFKLRSRIEDEDQDVSRIASVFGGGGHKSSASFQLEVDSCIAMNWISEDLIELSCYKDMIQSKKRKLTSNND